MRNKAFEKLLKEAILLDAEEQGAHMDASNEPIPETAQARFDAALNGNRKEPKRTASEAPSEQPQPVKRAHRWLAYGLTAVSAAAVILVVVLLIGTGGLRGTKPAEPGEPLPCAHATFANENAAIVAMMRFYEENRTLLMAVAADLKAPEHGEIENGVVYPITTSGLADRDHPYASTTDSIKAFLDLPDSGDYNLWWNDSVFHVSLQWTNDSGYYSTELVFAEDGQRIVNMMSEEQGTTLEPVYEDSAWGVYTICWKKAPYYHDASYALGPETGVWETDDVPFLYLELLDDGTARILERFGDADIRAHYAWNMTSRNIVLLTFSDQTIVRTAELNTDTDTMTLTLADGSTIEATRVSYRLIVEFRAEDLEGVWREWTPDNVDVGYRLTLFRDGTAKMVYQIPLSGEQTIEGTYSVKNGITVTFGDETMQAVYDPESDALLLFESETSWLTLYRNPDTYMLEHWFEMQRKPLLKKTVAMEDLFGVWTLERAESAFSSFDLSGLSGYLSIEQGSFRIGMRLAGEDHSASLACSVIDSVLTETGNSNGKIIAILDPYTNELKLCTLFYERELTEADPVLVFRKLSNAEQTMTQDALVGTWRLKAMESEVSGGRFS